MIPSDIRFLVVDDQESVRATVIRHLRANGYDGRVFEAIGGAEALRVLYEKLNTPESIQFIISDWNMPGRVSGLNFLKAVRSDQNFHQLPFLMATAESEYDQVMEAARAGVSNYIVKPIEQHTLDEKIIDIWLRHMVND